MLDNINTIYNIVLIYRISRLSMSSCITKWILKLVSANKLRAGNLCFLFKSNKFSASNQMIPFFALARRSNLNVFHFESWLCWWYGYRWNDVRLWGHHCIILRYSRTVFFIWRRWWWRYRWRCDNNRHIGIGIVVWCHRMSLLDIWWMLLLW